MRTLVVVPVRGGSRGVPRKNLREVAGKPLVVWTIEQALAMTTPGVEVRVSTEDPELAAVARAAGVLVLERPAHLAHDSTPTEPVVEHALDLWSAANGEPDRVMLLQATSPVRRPGTLDRALAEFAQTGVDSLVGVVPQAPFLWQATPLGPVPAYDVERRPRRQDLTAESLRYRETGSLYVTRPEVYRERHNRIGGRVGLFVMADDEGLDIDTELDLAVAGQHLARQRAAEDRA
ncbi:MAG: acylneuraminate cytidylyltransferase family protein [Nocardioidaceae bacterium]|nr:acylneuraminate cytidylyltransferase family protein [Nocardioidaceae bacterium]